MTFTISYKDKRCKLITKELYKKDSVITTVKELTEREWHEFKDEIEGAYFWNLAPMDGDPYRIGADGLFGF